MALTNDVIAEDLLALANLYSLQDILQNILTNLNFILTGSSGSQITISNANLYQLAAKAYNDATQWTTIAQANNLVDPLVQGGAITQVTVINNGSGYINPVVDIIGNAVIEANLQAVVGVSGEITEIKIVTPGQYLSPVQILVTDVLGRNCMATATLAATLIIPQKSTPSGGVLTV